MKSCSNKEAKVIIIGCGNVGRTVANALHSAANKTEAKVNSLAVAMCDAGVSASEAAEAMQLACNAFKVIKPIIHEPKPYNKHAVRHRSKSKW
jgi:homoserine dehydrogenase